MPRGRKRSAEGTVSSSTVVNASDFVAPGGGTQNDIAKLSKTLNLPVDTITAMMNCGGQGVASGRSSSRRSGGGGDAAGASAAAAMDPAMMNVWGDFMSEEMTSAPAAAPSAAAAASAAATATKEEEESKPAAAASSRSSAADESTVDGPRSYSLPIPPRMRLLSAGKKSNDEDYEVPTPGLLAQTGTLDASV